MEAEQCHAMSGKAWNLSSDALCDCFFNIRQYCNVF
jgi:hypothetical protein